MLEYCLRSKLRVDLQLVLSQCTMVVVEVSTVAFSGSVAVEAGVKWSSAPGNLGCVVRFIGWVRLVILAGDFVRGAAI